MLRYKSLFFIESDNYIFRYNTNNDKLSVNNKEDYSDAIMNKAEKTIISSVYEREMVRIVLEREYE